MWAEGAASSGGYSGVAEVSRRGGADGSRREGPDIWNTEELEKSWKERTCRKKKKSKWLSQSVTRGRCPALEQRGAWPRGTHTLSAGARPGQILVRVPLVPAGAGRTRQAPPHGGIRPDLTGHAHLSQVMQLSTCRWRRVNATTAAHEEHTASATAAHLCCPLQAAAWTMMGAPHTAPCWSKVPPAVALHWKQSLLSSGPACTTQHTQTHNREISQAVL